jgi:hypothetical protein
MRISRESLEREAAMTGFRAGILEKVIHLSAFWAVLRNILS